MTKRTARLLLMAGLAGAMVAVWTLSDEWKKGRAERINYSQLIELGAADMLRSTPAEPLVLTSNRLKGKYFDAVLKIEKDFEGIIPSGSQHTLADTLVAQGLVVKVESEEGAPWVHFLLTFGLPLVLLAGIVLFTLNRHLNGAGAERGSGGKGRARPRVQGKSQTTFKDVAGADEAKEELQEIVDFLKQPQRFRRLGGQIPRGVLLTGPPGTGKTLLARALAGEADVPFLSISASEFVEIFVGVGASRVRDLFAEGRRRAPCIIFVDEIDSIGRHRGSGLGGGHDEREQALNQLLAEMDGFESSEGIIMVGATNRPDILDPALLRPGRFDRHVVIALPDVRGREDILRIHLRRVPTAHDVDIPLLASSTAGFSGAQLEKLVNEAAIRAARFNRDSVTMADFLEAKDTSLMGRERRSLTVGAQDRIAAAYREAGHVLVAWLLPETDPVLKATIVPRADVLGTTIQAPDGDRIRITRESVESAIAILMARRCAEEIFLGAATSAVAGDLSEATKLAHRMVCEWGMAEETGLLSLGTSEETLFLGREITRYRNFSKATSTRIDGAVRRLVMQGHRKAREILEGGKGTVERLAAALQEQETLDSRQLRRLIESESPC